MSRRRREVLQSAPMAASRKGPPRSPEPVSVPGLADFPLPEGRNQSTQAAFGKIMGELSKREDAFADRIVTTSPDVTVSTNLGAFVNRRGIFAREPKEDVFKSMKIVSPQTWRHVTSGQHIELGIAENNLFLMLAALGLSADLFGERLFPVGTVYDPFVARGLDALNYASYQDARFIIVGTPSGVTLAPEGGAHQSVSAPLIGMGQPGLTYWEPAFADETALILRHAFEQIERNDGGSSYLRLSTRSLDQPDRPGDDWQEGALKGGYWRVKPEPDAPVSIVYTGALAPEAEAAFEALKEDVPGAGLLAVTSPDLLHRSWMRGKRKKWTGEAGEASHVGDLLSVTAPGSGLVTLVDGAPSTLSWLGSVRGQRVEALGVETFGQTGDLPDLYATLRLDADAVLDACAALLA